MWLIHMIYPELNTAQGSRKGTTLAARGLVRIVEMQVGHARSEKEAQQQCVSLAIQTLKDHGYQSTVIGYGIRNFYAKKGAKLSWKMSLQQIVRVLKLRKERRDAAVQLMKTAGTKKPRVKKAA
jgi:hypothetical protein